jgi:hypothetical protein
LLADPEKETITLVVSMLLVLRQGAKPDWL